MKDSPLLKSPIFIPKLTGQEGAFVDLDLKYSACLMDAHIVSRFSTPAEKISKACDVFIVDPITNYFVEIGYLQKPTICNLPYSPKEPFRVEDLYRGEVMRVEEMVIPSIEYQINNNADVIILPYLFADDSEHTRFGVNLNLISDGIKYARDKKIKKPLFAMLNMGGVVLSQPRILNYIIERYDDDYGNNIHGYFITMGRDFVHKGASDESLHGLAHLAFQLTKNKKQVFVLRIGAFGEILSAIGADGFSSGIDRGESFDEEGLREKSSNFGRDISKWTYVPELFNHVNDEAIKRTNYKCNCKSCGGSLPKDVFSKKAHFLYRRMETMNELRKLGRTKRIGLMKARLEEAIKLASHYNEKYTLSLQVNHLINWRNVLESAQHWTHDDSQSKKSVDLDQLIHEARSKRK